MVIYLTPGQAHEAPVLPRLLTPGRSSGPGLLGGQGVGGPGCGPRGWPVTRATATPARGRQLRRRGIGVVIPTKSNQRRSPRFDKQAYRERNRVERTINRLKGFRRVATRYEKRGVNYEAMVVIAAIVLLWL